jgi:adhesin transport system membrane fusion protein
MMHLSNETIFERGGTLIRRLTLTSNKLFGRVVQRLIPVEQGDALDLRDSADWALFQQEPLRARMLIRVLVSVVLLLIFWAAFAEVDEVTHGTGKVVPTSQLQVIQSVDGGVVEALMVKEGQEVLAGQLLLRVDSTRFESSMMENHSEQLALQAKELRLEALTRGKSFNPPDDLQKAAPDIVAQEMRLYESRRDGIAALVSISQNQLSQRQHELTEMRARREQAERSLEFTLQELNSTRPMVASGAVSEVEVLRLEREASRLRGDRDQSSAQISRVQSAIQEAQRRVEDVQLSNRNQMSAELSEVMSKRASITQGGRTLEDKVKHADVVSPMRGIVKRLLVNTVGGVVLPGKELVEIVPLDDTLIMEAQVNPKDIAFLRPGQRAMVKFTAYDFSIYGGLKAELINIGADTVLDEKGNAFYLVRVRTEKHQLGEKLPIIPGMMVQVDILTGKKSVLSYLIKPVLRAKANALTER